MAVHLHRWEKPLQKHLAEQIVHAGLASSAALQELLPTLRQDLSADDYKAYARSVARIIDLIGVSLLSPAIAAYPELAPPADPNVP